jgi:hypothetical protein
VRYKTKLYIRYEIANPAIFGVGDIVEGQVSFTVVPMKKGKFKMLLVLRALTLINRVYSLVS